MKMTRRNFLSTSAVAAFACGASLTAHAAGSTDENSLNFITDIFKDPTQPGEIEEATAITAEKNAEWYEKLDFSDRRELDNLDLTKSCLLQIRFTVHNAMLFTRCAHCSG